MNTNPYFILFSHEIVHFLLCFMVGYYFWRKNHDWRLFLIAYVFGFLVDIDHWLDYFLHYGFVINLINFFNVGSYIREGWTVYVLLHGWEFVLIWYGIGWWVEKKTKIKYLALVLMLAYLSHLIWDNISFSHHPLAYSFIYRLLNGFTQASFE